jgi:hypothetical protein
MNDDLLPFAAWAVKIAVILFAVGLSQLNERIPDGWKKITDPILCVLACIAAIIFII